MKIKLYIAVKMILLKVKTMIVLIGLSLKFSVFGKIDTRSLELDNAFETLFILFYFYFFCNSHLQMKMKHKITNSVY